MSNTIQSLQASTRPDAPSDVNQPKNVMGRYMSVILSEIGIKMGDIGARLQQTEQRQAELVDAARVSTRLNAALANAKKTSDTSGPIAKDMVDWLITNQVMIDGKPAMTFFRDNAKQVDANGNWWGPVENIQSAQAGIEIFKQERVDAGQTEMLLLSQALSTYQTAVTEAGSQIDRTRNMNAGIVRGS